MAKVTRNRLARGTKLTPEHISATIDTVASPRVGYQINNATFDRENISEKFAPFRIHLSVPFIDSTYKFTVGGNSEIRTFAMPFMLPPLQDSFALTAVNGRLFPDASGASLPRPVLLDEVAISIDQRAEPAAIVDSYQATTLGDSAFQGQMDFDSQPELNLRFGISQKKPVRFGASVPFATEDMDVVELFSSDITYPNWLADGPYAIRGINKYIDPYQTYVVTVEWPDLMDKKLAIVSLNVSMRFIHELVARDTGSDIQNLPNKGDARQTRAVVDAATGLTTSVVVLTPTAGTSIDADTTDGVSYNLGILDEAIADRFTGGRDRFGEVGPTEELAVDAGYEVIAVPMFGNRRRGGISAREAALEPYVTHAPGAFGRYLADRRIIPIAHPLTIHHVLLAYNWQIWDNVYMTAAGGVGAGGASTLPQSKFFKIEAGVGMATGLKGDNFAYDQIAYLSVQNPYAEDGTTSDPWNISDGGTWPPALIDIIKVSSSGSAIRNFSTVSTVATNDPIRFWDWDLFQVPLVGAGGTGYVAQGHPVYVGRSWTPTAVDATTGYNNDRQDISAAAPNCEGQEQWLEIRMKISDNLYAGVTSLVITAPGTGYSNGTGIATSYGGGGTGLTVDITTFAGAITAATINQSGRAYTDGDLVTVAGGTGGTLTVTVNAGLETLTDGGALSNSDFISGYGGHWVYLICKKNLT